MKRKLRASSAQKIRWERGLLQRMVELALEGIKDAEVGSDNYESARAFFLYDQSERLTNAGIGAFSFRGACTVLGLNYRASVDKVEKIVKKREVYRRIRSPR